MLFLDRTSSKTDPCTHPRKKSESPFHISVAATLDRGMVRKINEDNYYRSDRDPDVNPADGRLFLVVDGVGGNGGGNLASLIACERLPHYFFAPANSNLTLATRLALAIEQTHHDIIAAGAKTEIFKEMSCTFVAFAEHNGEAIIGHMGDSRGYCLRYDQIYQLTTDHNVAQELAHMGYIDSDQIDLNQFRHVLTRALGGHTSNYSQGADINYLRLQAGDRYILCSDGLHSVVCEAEIQALASQPKSGYDIVKDLVRAANDYGGPDNIVVMSLTVQARDKTRRD